MPHKKNTTKTPPQEKVFNDPIHGHIELHLLLVKIIDTPQFQRLRNIKQLGGAYFVYPGASHNRFEHSIGVSYLAGQLLEALKSRQPELKITPQDILCVQIAGLCHDLGHGPFSHLFDDMFIPEASKKKGRKSDDWKHETASLELFDCMVRSNNLVEEMKKYDLKMPEDLSFIKEMIKGSPDTDKDGVQKESSSSQWSYKGRGKEKSFLYEIVSNKLNGIDVDKFDYLARDCYHLGIRSNFDHHRFLKYARVCEVEKSKRICIRDKMVDDMYDLFNTRYLLHRRVCYHRVTNIIQIMIRDAFLMADKHLQIEGSLGQKFTLSTAKNDIEAYIQLTDTVFDQILHSKDQNLKDAKKVLQRIISRDLYKLLGEKKGGKNEKKNKALISKWKTELTQKLPEGLAPEDFEVMPITFDYGMGEKNPFDSIYFYTKENNTVASIMPKEKRPKIVTNDFSERVIRFYFKKTDETSQKRAQTHFEEWNEPVQPESNPAKKAKKNN